MRGGMLIREARQRAGLTQAELAALLGVHASSVSDWERGSRDPAFGVVRRAAEECGLDLLLRLDAKDPSDELMAERHLSLAVQGRLRMLRSMLETERALWAAGRQAGLLAEERLPYEPLEVLHAPELIEVLVRHGVRFVVVGGLAAIVHGSPLRTGDLDVTPATDRENLERLGGALRELRAGLRVTGIAQELPFDPVASTLGRAVVWNLTTKYGDLDLAFLPAGTRGYDDLRRGARMTPFGDVEAPVASLADVIRSKEAAGREKDRAALPVLRKLLARLDEGQRRSP